MGKLDRLSRDDQQNGTQKWDTSSWKTSHARVFRASRPSRGSMNSSGGIWNLPRGRNLLKAHSHKDESVEPGLSRHGWQKTAHMCFEKKHFEERVWPTLNNTDRAMSRSQRGPLAATPFVSVPSNRFSNFDPTVVQGAPPTPPSSSHSFVFEILQVWPPTRPTWPPQRGDAQKQEFWGDVVSLWKGQQHRCAVKLEEGFLPTCWSETWTWQCSTISTAAGWKWWRTDSLGGTDRSWRFTQHWSLHCTVMEQPDGGQQTTMGVALEHARRRKAATCP